MARPPAKPPVGSAQHSAGRYSMLSRLENTRRRDSSMASEAVLPLASTITERVKTAPGSVAMNLTQKSPARGMPARSIARSTSAPVNAEPAPLRPISQKSSFRSVKPSSTGCVAAPMVACGLPGVESGGRPAGPFVATDPPRA